MECHLPRRAGEFTIGHTPESAQFPNRQTKDERDMRGAIAFTCDPMKADGWFYESVAFFSAARLVGLHAIFTQHFYGVADATVYVVQPFLGGKDACVLRSTFDFNFGFHFTFVR